MSGTAWRVNAIAGIRLALIGLLPALANADDRRTVNLVVREDVYVINGVETHSLQDLKAIANPRERPTIIVSGHVCTETTRVAEVVELIKDLGYRQIVLEAFGLFQDAECVLPDEQRWWRRSGNQSK